MRSIPDSRFRTSSYSQPSGSNCVEVAGLDGRAAMRDTEDRQAGHLEFAAREWAAFVEALKSDGV